MPLRCFSVRLGIPICLVALAKKWWKVFSMLINLAITTRIKMKHFGVNFLNFFEMNPYIETVS